MNEEKPRIRFASQEVKVEDANSAKNIKNNHQCNNSGYHRVGENIVPSWYNNNKSFQQTSNNINGQQAGIGLNRVNNRKGPQKDVANIKEQTGSVNYDQQAHVWDDSNTVLTGR